MYGYPHYEPKPSPPEISPQERVQQLLMDLRFQQKKPQLDIDRIAFLRKEISAYPKDMVEAALNKVVDDHGW